MQDVLRKAAFISIMFLFVGLASFVSAQTIETGKFTLYKYQKQLGSETYSISAEDDELKIDARFGLSFIGSGFSVDTKLTLDAQSLSPKFFETKGKTSTRTSVDSSVEISGDKATVFYNSRTQTEKVPTTFFTLLQPAPITPQMMLLRYWKKHNVKGDIKLLPGGRAKIEFLGEDKVKFRGKETKLDRYAIEGVMWGREIAWLDKDQKLIALVAADAEMDRFEAVREGFEDSLGFFVKRAAEDALNQLKALSEKIKPIHKSSYAIVGGLLVGGKNFGTISDSVILIEKGKIGAVGPRGEVRIPKGMKVFDASGKTIIPGLFDMHAHATQAEWFPASLAAGITTMRDAANEFEFITPIRDGVKSGAITVSPRILLAGYIDSGPSSVGSMKAETPIEARAIVNKYKKAGFQQIKIYQSLKPELVKVVADEAHKLGMTVTGHVPTGMNIYTAVDAGYDQVNHLGFVFRVMSPRILTEGERRNFDLEAESAKEGFRFLKENKIVVEPTLARAENSVKILGGSFLTNEPGVAKLPFEFSALITSMGIPREQAERRQRRGAFSLTVLKALHDYGIPLVVGTDLVVPGHTEYREIELFVKAGISPIDAIKAATIVPARAMKLEKELGTIEKGKIADLVLIDGNPLESISNIRKVKFVVKDGRMYDSAPLWRSVNFKP